MCEWRYCGGKGSLPFLKRVNLSKKKMKLGLGESKCQESMRFLAGVKSGFTPA